MAELFNTFDQYPDNVKNGLTVTSLSGLVLEVLNGIGNPDELGDCAEHVVNYRIKKVLGNPLPETLLMVEHLFYMMVALLRQVGILGILDSCFIQLDQIMTGNMVVFTILPDDY